jgi:hypothetical protein
MGSSSVFGHLELPFVPAMRKASQIFVPFAMGLFATRIVRKAMQCLARGDASTKKLLINAEP